ncbi:MAG: DUF4214 domain-containing protein [Betaproteobacteria bacterium]|nr:DUF4214 domain-containing protein [Betaproteobacteria bacterium]
MNILAGSLAGITALLLLAGNAAASTYFSGDVTKVAANLYEGPGGELINTLSCSIPADQTPVTVRIDGTGVVVGQITFGAAGTCDIAAVYAPYTQAVPGSYQSVLTSFDTGYFLDTTYEPNWIIRTAPSCPTVTGAAALATLTAMGPSYLPPGNTPVGTLAFTGGSAVTCPLIGIFGKVTLTTLPTYELAVSKDGNGFGTVTSDPLPIDCGATCSASFGPQTTVTLTATPSAGSVFAGWGGACSGAAACVLTLEASASVTATFLVEAPSKASLSLSKTGSGTGTVSSTPAGIDCGPTCSGLFTINQAVQLSATPAGDSTFVGWGGACTGAGACVVPMTAAATVTATFDLTAPTTHSLSVTRIGTGSGSVASLPAGIDCGATCTASFANGSTVTLTPTPAAGSVFVGWSGSCSGSGACSITLGSGATVAAQFANAAPTTFRLDVAKAGAGSGSVSSQPSGVDCGTTCQGDFPARSVVALAATPAVGSAFTGWSGACAGAGVCEVAMDAIKSVTATFDLATGSISPNPASLDFGGQSMNTTAPSQAVVLTNSGGAPVTVSSVTTSTYFSVTHNCATVNAGASCTANVAFTPTAEGSLNGTLTLQSSAGNVTVPLAGTGERSLVTHYYRSILRRAPDAGGKAFWESEKVRLPSLGANVNETWYAMATFFYFSSEYQSFNRDDNGFVSDLYNTFFNRPADGGGLTFWTGLLSQGMPREVVLVSFMFSTEFQGFTQAIFGNVQARKEVDTVVDFYRGLLSRLPDDGGLASWVSQFRSAQCAGAGSVYNTVESISSSFANGGEYASRNRTNAQYVGDLYNAFLRRGGDLGGVQFWISQLTGGATRSSIRQQFIASPEFTNRVNAIIAEGCMP